MTSTTTPLRVVVLLLTPLLSEAYGPSDPTIVWGGRSRLIGRPNQRRISKPKKEPTASTTQNGPNQDQHRVVIAPRVEQRRDARPFIRSTVGGGAALNTFVVREEKAIKTRHTENGFEVLDVKTDVKASEMESVDYNDESAAAVSLTLMDVIGMPHPGYVRVLQNDADGDETVLVSGFTVKGDTSLASIDVATGTATHANKHTTNTIVWPNEIEAVPSDLAGSSSSPTASKAAHRNHVVVSDGFLVPTKDRGGVFVVRNHGDEDQEEIVALTDTDAGNDWFYHRSVWVDLTGDGRKSLLTARCRTRFDWTKGGLGCDGELVWLECPKAPSEDGSSSFDPFAAEHTPWKTHVLATGPDVMFAVADMDPEDDTIEVISSQFFDQKVVLQSIQRGPEPKMVFERVLDANCGHAFSTVLADLEDVQKTMGNEAGKPLVIHSGSTVESRGRSKGEEGFSHLLVTSHACRYVSSTSGGGGSLLAYKVPMGHPGAWKSEDWEKQVIASDFRVKGHLANLINPGAPGFVYTFHTAADESRRSLPMIAVAGDCSESAYIYRPIHQKDGTTDALVHYELLLEIKCGATVGSIGIGYQSFAADRPHGVNKRKATTLYIPLYEKSKVLVFDLQGI